MPITSAQQDGGDDGGARARDSADAKRHAMRVALGRRMKRDLVEREQERLRKVQRPFIDSVGRGMRAHLSAGMLRILTASGGKWYYIVLSPKWTRRISTATFTVFLRLVARTTKGALLLKPLSDALIRWRVSARTRSLSARCTLSLLKLQCEWYTA